MAAPTCQLRPPRALKLLGLHVPIGSDYPRYLLTIEHGQKLHQLPHNASVLWIPSNRIFKIRRDKNNSSRDKGVNVGSSLPANPVRADLVAAFREVGDTTSTYHVDYARIFRFVS